jgi:hypothetical protein
MEFATARVRVVFLEIKAVDQIEEDFGFEVRHFQLVDIVPEKMVGLAFGGGDKNSSWNSPRRSYFEDRASAQKSRGQLDLTLQHIPKQYCRRVLLEQGGLSPNALIKLKRFVE